MRPSKTNDQSTINQVGEKQLVTGILNHMPCLSYRDLKSPKESKWPCKKTRSEGEKSAIGTRPRTSTLLWECNLSLLIHRILLGQILSSQEHFIKSAGGIWLSMLETCISTPHHRGLWFRLLLPFDGTLTTLWEYDDFSTNSWCRMLFVDGLYIYNFSTLLSRVPVSILPTWNCRTF